ncbi:MAG: glutaredoxin domain-containing protein [Candidatus Nezhaarchaeales archaeon]|nr:MAG: NrdH-redoxin [Candidatus Nezhaarchaeota archaeon WYZ-LMO8]TDA35559.1 MAG: NrdH-redoxin [Candidatus Nezhaarchaeota archaeon WYZ-LMO7]
MVKVKLYVSPQCPRCEVLKKVLNEMGVEYEVVDVSHSDVMADLIMRDVFLMETPGLEIDGKFFYASDLFSGDKLLLDNLRKIIEGL